MLNIASNPLQQQVVRFGQDDKKPEAPKADAPKVDKTPLDNAKIQRDAQKVADGSGLPGGNSLEGLLKKISEETTKAADAAKKALKQATDAAKAKANDPKVAEQIDQAREAAEKATDATREAVKDAVDKFKKWWNKDK